MTDKTCLTATLGILPGTHFSSLDRTMDLFHEQKLHATLCRLNRHVHLQHRRHECCKAVLRDDCLGFLGLGVQEGPELLVSELLDVSAPGDHITLDGRSTQ